MPRHDRRNVVSVGIAVLALAVTVLRIVLLLVRASPSDRGILLLALPLGVVAILALVVVLIAVLRGRALARVHALRLSEPGALVLSCLVPRGFGRLVQDLPGARHGRRLGNANAALLVDAGGLSLYRGAGRPRLARSIPTSAIESVRVERTLAGPVRLVPSLIIAVRAESGTVELPLQLAEWDRTLFPRFGKPDLVEHRADEVRRALGLQGAAAPTGSGTV